MVYYLIVVRNDSESSFNASQRVSFVAEQKKYFIVKKKTLLNSLLVSGSKLLC